MKLKRAHIREFWSILDSNPFEIGDKTCLVGKNEAGKTAILQALYRLNPVEVAEGKFSVTDDYPRAFVMDYERQVDEKKRSPATVIEASFELEQEDIQEITASFGPNVLPAMRLELLKGYENVLRYHLEVDERAAGEFLLERSHLTSSIATSTVSWTSLSELLQIMNGIAEAKETEFNKAKAAAEASTDEDEKRKGLVEAQLLQESAASSQLRTELKGICGTGLTANIFAKLQLKIPQFLYFDEYYQMRGCENIRALRQRVTDGALKKSDHPLLGLISLARLKLDDLLNVTRTRELKNRLEGASNYLSQKIIKYWSQNQYLRLEFDVREPKSGDPVDMRDGPNIWGSVHDSKHFVTTDLSSRSRGFVWFYSFLAWYSQLEESKRLILLLDEPGLSLHAKAQEDLLRFLEEQLKPSHQLIYTTHSPFLVDPRHFDRVRIVQDRSIEIGEELPESEQGTKVVLDVLEATGDSLFPLQGALGYEIYQTLFIGPNTLVVEGASDLLYLQVISAVLESEKRERLNPKWTITPVGGADRVPAFVALIGSQNNLNVATLIDIQKKHVQMIENLYKKKLLKKSHVLTFGDYAEKPEADVEDVFDRTFYVALVNNEFRDELTKPIDPADLNRGQPRVLKALEDYFAANPLKDGGAFSHYRPARYMVENIGKLSANIDTNCLNRFENAFKALNKLIDT